MKIFAKILSVLVLFYLLFTQTAFAQTTSNDNYCYTFDQQGNPNPFERAPGATCPECYKVCFNGNKIRCELECPNYKDCGGGVIVLEGYDCPPDCSSDTVTNSTKVCDVFNSSGQLVQITIAADGNCPQCAKVCHNGRKISCTDECPGYKKCGNYAFVPEGRDCPPEYCPTSSGAKNSSKAVDSSQVKSSSAAVLSSSAGISSSRANSSSPSPIESSKKNSSQVASNATNNTTSSTMCFGTAAKVTVTRGGQNNVGISKDEGVTCLDSLKNLPQLSYADYYESENRREYAAVFSGINTCDNIKNMNLPDKDKKALCELSKPENDNTTFYFGPNCNLMTEAELTELNSGLPLCVEFSMEIGFVTPVSLVWKKDSVVTPTVVNFPLDPNSADKFVIWKGSDASPLVVYDPGKTGKITNAQQLFGQHTFGKAWKDGFEALASLDENGDGKLSGDELKDLSLWFDHNQNAVSEDWEVVDLRQAGVTELYFKRDGDNTKDGSIIVTKGYRRVDEQGQVTEGAAVDWFSDLYSTKDKAEQATKVMAANEAKAVQEVVAGNFSGVWVWNVDSEYLKSQFTNSGGILLFSQEGSNISGNSIAEFALGDNKANVKSAVLSLPVTGAVSDGGKNNPQLKFKITNKGLTTETTAELARGGIVMTGVSRVETINKKTGRKETVHYTWSARRVG